MLFFRRKTALVCGISMDPLLKSGDIVLYKHYFNKSNVSIGDIIIFNHPTKNIKLIKKITAIREFGVEVSGENSNFSDDSNYFGLIQKDCITGIVTSRIPKNSISNIKAIFKLKK
tara:strand:+ start:1217 stop:1561 length:345 start_codon:yes stop_codon:yes gene_type:complete